MRLRRRPAPASARPARPKLKRQRGTERRTGAASVMHPVPTRRAMSGARFALFLTVLAWAAYVVEQVRRYLSGPFSVRTTIEAGVYLVLVTLLAASASAYLLARLGHLVRVRDHRRVPRVLLDALFEQSNPTLTVIVPSYREDARVIRQTLLSAALQEYPSLRVVLLVDDPPSPTDPAHVALLEAARAVPGEVAALLAEPRAAAEAALELFESHVPPGAGEAGAGALLALAARYDDAVRALESIGEAYPIVDHSDCFLVDEVVLGLARDLSTTARALREAAESGAGISVDRVRHLYRRLVWIFRAELLSFERKRFASLSHEPNKAANLNSFIGLMGGRYRVRETHQGSILLPVRSGPFDMEEPDPDYVLTLDADSTLLPEYCLRLVAFMERPENADVAVAQTPYSAYRGATTRIERIAGATTDLQHLVHQGLTRHDATFWVGANAVLRKRALDDIRVEEPHNGFTVRRYIQDRTPIEDTESSIDMRAHGWRLHNEPERLSYSATPPDFGALCVQRERWANGGLVILPKLLRLRRTPRGTAGRPTLVELFLRVNYLASIAWASVGLWLLLAYPFDQRLLSRWAILTALPYFVAQANDLRRCGYRRIDVLGLYGFNLMLLAVNTVGAVKSVAQAIGGQKVAFARTPKVRNRTVAPLAYVLIPFLIAAWSGVTLAQDIAAGRTMHAVFAGVNATLSLAAMVSFHGFRSSIVDVVMDVRERLYTSPRRTSTADGDGDWVTVLYHGATASGEGAEAASAAAHALAAMDEERAGRERDILLDSTGSVLVAPPEAPVAPEAPAVPEKAPAVRPVAADDLGATLAEALRALPEGGTMRLRLVGDDVEIGVDPPPTDAPERRRPRFAVEPQAGD